MGLVFSISNFFIKKSSMANKWMSFSFSNSALNIYVLVSIRQAHSGPDRPSPGRPVWNLVGRPFTLNSSMGELAQAQSFWLSFWPFGNQHKGPTQQCQVRAFFLHWSEARLLNFKVCLFTTATNLRILKFH